jgi:hypothetical protein
LANLRAEPQLLLNHQLFSFWWYRGLNSECTPWATPPTLFFVMDVFKMGSHELFAQAGFKPRSSWLTRITSVSHWHSVQTPALTPFWKFSTTVGHG